MPNIFDYLSYREFLRDCYAEQKAEAPFKSYSYLAEKAGFKSKSFIPHVIEGKKNLSKESIYKIARTLKLDKKAFSYFEDLVAFNQATTLEQRNYFYARLSEYNRRNTARVVQKRQFEFYSRWYHNTIRELVTIVDFKDDYKLLARMIRPNLTARQARDSVQLLVKLGLIEKKQGRYTQTDRAITTGDEIAALAILNFHVQNLALAAEQVSVCPSAERDISAMVVGLSARGFKTIKEEIQSFRKRIADIVEQDQPAERVYHINFQLLPTSERME
jgi:uncharacterized protein (TIGR02147 family)